MSPAQVAAARVAAARGRAARSETAAERCEVYSRLRRGGYTIQQAAWELHITRRHADRYERIRKQNA